MAGVSLHPGGERQGTEGSESRPVSDQCPEALADQGGARGGGGAGTGCVLASALQRASRKIRDQAALGQCWAREPVKCTKGLEAVTSLTQPQLPRALPSITTPLDSPLPSSVLPKPLP